MNSQKIILYVSLAVSGVIMAVLGFQNPLTLLGVIAGGGAGFSGMMVYYRRLDQENARLQQQLNAYQEYGQVEQQLPRLQNSYSDLVTQNQQLEEQHQQTTDNLAQINEQIAGRRERLRQLNQSLEDSEQRRETQQQTLNQLEERIAELNQDYPNLSDQEALQREIQELRSNRSGLQGEIQSLQQQNQRIVQEREGEIQRTQSLLQPLNEEINKLEDRRNQQQQTLNNLEERIASLNQDYPNLSDQEALQREIQELRSNRSGLQGEIQSLQQHTEQKQERLQQLETQLETQQNEFNQQQQQQVELAGDIRQKQSQQQSLTEEIEQLQQQKEELNQITTDLEFLRVTYDRLDAERQEHENRVEELRPEIERLEAERNRILQEIQNNQPDYQEIQEHRRILNDLIWQIREKESRVRELDSEISQLETIRNSRHEEVTRLQEEEKVLEKRIAQLQGEISVIEESSEQALKSLKKGLWSLDNLPKTQTTIESETEFITSFGDFLNNQGLSFPSRAIKSFHTSLKVQDISSLAILAGISGTGKSELPRQYANFIGAQFLMLAVQPRWDSPQDLLGFYNYVEQKYKPTDLMRGLYQFNHQETLQDRLVIVLLDEMNLARVEYYFSEFLSKLETRRSQDTYLDIDVGSIPLPDEERRVKIPEQFLFVGTMNEDETTQTLSDKVLDRANVLTFGKPSQLQLRGNSNSHQTPVEYLSYNDFQGWIKQPHQNDTVVENVKKYLDDTNQVMETMGYPFAHRVYQAITKYVVNYPGVVDSNSPEFKSAIADQFGQKILPKLRGLMVDEAKSELDDLQTILQDIDDQSLIHAFENARQGKFGQFQWRGLVYEEAGENQ